MIWKTLLMRKALTNAVMKAKISKPVPKALMNTPTSASPSAISTSRVTTSVPGGSISSIRLCTVATS